MSDEHEHDPLAEVRAALWKQGLAIILSGITMLGSAAGVFYVRVSEDRARAEEVHHRLERDVEAIQRDRREDADALDDLSGDMRALKAAYEAGQADTRSRLVRIESALDGRRR